MGGGAGCGVMLLALPVFFISMKLMVMRFERFASVDCAGKRISR